MCVRSSKEGQAEEGPSPIVRLTTYLLKKREGIDNTRTCGHRKIKKIICGVCWQPALEASKLSRGLGPG